MEEESGESIYVACENCGGATSVHVDSTYNPPVLCESCFNEDFESVLKGTK